MVSLGIFDEGGVTDNNYIRIIKNICSKFSLLLFKFKCSNINKNY